MGELNIFGLPEDSATLMVVTVQILNPRTSMVGFGLPTKLVLLHLTLETNSTIGLKLEDSAHQGHNLITVNKSNKTEVKKLVSLFSTTFMEMALNGTMLLVITKSQLFVKM